MGLRLDVNGVVCFSADAGLASGLEGDVERYGVVFAKERFEPPQRATVVTVRELVSAANGIADRHRRFAEVETWNVDPATVTASGKDSV